MQITNMSGQSETRGSIQHHSSSSIFAAGQRVIIRDAEWVIRRADLLEDGGYEIICNGISNFVKGKESIFLSSYEPIQIINPEETSFIFDPSSAYERSILFMESLMRELLPNDQKIYRGQKAAMDLVDYQFTPALEALSQPRQRILMGDAVGLGKTLEAGILTSELIKRGKGKRILVLAVKSMLTQFQKEFWNRFSIPLTRLDSQGIQRVRNKIPANMNPFLYYDKSIISIDTLKQESLYRSYIEKSYWDIIIIDEAHNVADRNTHSKKSKLARLISSRCDSLIMLSATPHDGSAKSFASLLNMLDPTAIADPNNYSVNDFKDKGLVIRRFKKDIQNQVNDEFQKRKVFEDEGKAEASKAEEEIFDFLSTLKFQTLDQNKRRGSDLFKTTLIKSIMSSPMACLSSVQERLKKLENKEGNYEKDIEALLYLKSKLENISASEFSKYNRLVNLIKKDINWKKKKDDRLVIFTERIKTLEFLKEHLQKDLNLKENEIITMTGSMPDVEINKIVEDFGQENSKIRLLIATDVASEGINLHYLSHRLFHFDIPWSLMVFQQRNGRIDRYGQEKAPEIYYMQTASKNETFLGDNRIFEILIEKDKQAAENIGDPSAFMNVYDTKKEEAITAEAIVNGESPEHFRKKLDDNAKAAEFDFLALLNKEPQEKKDVFKTSPSLFSSDMDYAKAAFQFLETQKSMDVTYEEHRLSFSAPEDLKYRFKMLPKEVWPDKGYFILSDNQEIIKREIKESRKQEKAWPQIHYLWEQHPVMEWLRDKMLSNFNRLEAPLLELPTLEKDEIIFLVSGLIPNKKAQPLINQWMGIQFKQGLILNTLSLEEVFEKTQLNQKTFPNRNEMNENSLKNIHLLLPKAIQKAKLEMEKEHANFEEKNNHKIIEHLNELEKLKKRHLSQVDKEKTPRKNRDEEIRRIEKIFRDYQNWIEDTMKAEGKNAFIQVIAALKGESA